MEKSKKKYLWFLLLIPVVAVVLILVFTLGGVEGESALEKELGGFSDTYAGTLSEEKYDSSEAAAYAFVCEEIESAEMETSTIKVELEGTATDKEIKEVGITDEMLEGATSVEKYLATWNEVDRRTASKLNVCYADGTVRYYVYVIGGDNWFKYFSPVPETGETVTKSYYDSIFNSPKYSNCTFIKSTKMTIKMMLVSVNITVNITTKYADNCILWEQRIESDYDIDLGLESGDFYIELDEDGDPTNVYMLESGSWVRAYLNDYSILKPFGDQYLHYSYFTKTNYGCTLKGNNLETYFRQASSLVNVSSISLNKGYINYYVSQGVLSGLLGEIDFSYSVEGVSASATAKYNIKCIDYGTTQVERPF